MSLSLPTRQDRLLAIRARIDAHGGGAAHVYALPVAASPESAAEASPLAILVLPVPCGDIGSTPEGLATLTLDLEGAVGYAAVAGQAAWVRFVDGAGTAVYDAEAGLPGSGKPVILTDGKTPPTTNLFVGGEVQLASAVWVE